MANGYAAACRYRKSWWMLLAKAEPRARQRLGRVTGRGGRFVVSMLDSSDFLVAIRASGGSVTSDGAQEAGGARCPRCSDEASNPALCLQACSGPLAA